MLVALLAAAGRRGAPGSPGELRAGAAVVDITPPPGLPLWGYGGRRDLPCKEAHDNLEVSVLVLEFNGGGSVPDIRRSKNRLALIGMDMGRAPGRSTMKKIRQVLLEKAGIENLFLVASHTHHGPCMELEKTGLTAAYIKTLVDRIAAASVSAVKSLRPAKMGVASRQVDLTRNRHDRRVGAPVDRTLSVVRVVGLDDSSIATVVNYAAHPTSLPAIMMKYSSDYPGILKDLVEKALGGVCVFLQGAAGDLSVKLDGQGTRAYATELAKQVVSLAKTVKPAAPAQLVRDVKLAVKYNSGSCITQQAHGNCSDGARHQCSRCLGAHTASACDGSGPGDRPYSGKGGKGKGGKGKSGRK